MKIAPICNTAIRTKTTLPSFKSETTYQENKIVENDILTLYGQKGLFTNPISPKQDILGINLSRADERTIELTSRYGNKTGTIRYNPNANQPEMNLQVGSFQPIIELKDDDLGITILMTRGSDIKGSNLNITYKEITKPNISFGHRLVVTEGYKASQVQSIVDDYFEKNKASKVEKSDYANKLKLDYTIVGLGGGYGSRLKPISDINGDNKPSTKYPGSEKSLFEVSVLDTAARAGKIDDVKFIKEDTDKLSGTAGVIIKGLKNGTIPLDKPLVLLTGDTFNNIDLAKALYNYEQDPTSGISVLVKAEYTESNDLLDQALIKIKDLDCNIINNYDMSHGRYEGHSNPIIENPSPEIEELGGKITNENYKDFIDKYSSTVNIKTADDCNFLYNVSTRAEKQAFISTNFMIINPKILNILKNYGDEDGKADFVEFLGLMFNTLNKSDESLKDKYPLGLKSKDLKIDDLTYYNGTPRPIEDDKGHELKVKANIAEDIDGINIKMEGRGVKSCDVGTIEDYIKTVRSIDFWTIGLDKTFGESVNNSVDANGVIYMNPEARDKLSKFKQKYGISELRGNVIIHSSTPKSEPNNSTIPSIANKKPELKIVPNPKEIYNLTKNPEESQKFIQDLMANPDKLQEKSKEMINKYGLQSFISWYLSLDGYYGAYEKYVDNLYNKANSIEDLLKHEPNWAPWKLEEKYWLINHPEYQNYSKEYQKELFNEATDQKREQEFTVGDVPEIFNSKDTFEKLVTRLKTCEILDESVYINGSYYKAKRLKGGELNDKFVYLIEKNNQKVILKFDRMNVEDSSTIDGRNFSLLEKRSIRKNKYLSADSTYSNACISKYLELNGCKNVPKVLYYDHRSNASAFEYIEDANDDLFQNGLIDEEYVGLDEMNNSLKELNKFGIFLNDTACKNTLTDKNGIKKIIDLGHSNFIMPFKLGIKHYNIEFSNTNGPDISNIYAGLLLSQTN